MTIKKVYMINEKTVLLTGEYDSYGKLTTRVIEGEDTFLVDQTPTQVIDASLLQIGSSMQGALLSSKKLLGEQYMYPITVNPHLGIYLLPTHSLKKRNCVWFSLMHVKDVRAQSVKQTEVLTNYGHTIVINMKKSAFQAKHQTANQLRETVARNMQCPLSFYLEPRQGFYLKDDAKGNKLKIIKKS